MSGEGDAPQAIRKLAPASSSSPATTRARSAKSARCSRRTGSSRSSAGDLDLPEPEETGTTFVANAELKALQAADLSGLPALADDSGLCVEALDGDPGIFSARWAETPKGATSDLAMQLGRGRARPRRGRSAARRAFRLRARARLARRACRMVRGAGRRARWSGRRAATTASATTRCSCPTATTETFGEMEPDEKHALTHRADAFGKLVAAVL